MNEEISPLRKYVLTKKDKDVKKLEEVGIEWANVACENKLEYELDWMGIPIIQTPEDIVLMQELIYKIKPDVIIETGVAHGGSLIYYSSLMEIIGKGEIIGVDIDIRKHNREVIEKHPLFKRITLFEGDSTSQEIIDKIKAILPKNAVVVVCLDSDHTKGHVLKELKLYKQFVTPGSYFVVYDTITSKLAEKGSCDVSYINNGPSEAVDEFLANDNDFEIDKEYNKFYVSSSPNGYLRRKK